MKINALETIDFYKADHLRQYPKWTNFIFSNFTPRSDRLFKKWKEYDWKIVFFWLQYFIKDFLINCWNDTFFNLPKNDVIKAYKRRMDTSLGKNSIDTYHLELLHDLGYLPLEIRALEEWERSWMKIPVLTISNTKPEFFWLVNYIETALSTELWKSITNATIAFEYKKIFKKYANLTGWNTDFIKFQGHDFSARGLSCKEDWYKNWQAHLTSFVWTDTVLAISGIEDYYNWNSEKELIGTSIPATEHSVMSMWQKEKEIETFKRLISEIYPKWMVSIVSDTWDFWKVLWEHTIELKEDILKRWFDDFWNSKVVFRPDSWNPIDIICGYEFYKHVNWNIQKIRDENLNYLLEDGVIETEEDIINYSKNVHAVVKDWDKYYFNWKQLGKEEYKWAIETLWDVFWGITNEKWFKTLNPKVWLIYWDSITLERQNNILELLMKKWFSSDNIVLWIWSYTYQYSTRDTFWFAMKATYWEVNWKGIKIFKQPKTDTWIKNSAKGLLFVWKDKNWEYYLEEEVSKEKILSKSNQLKIVFKDWKIIRETSISEIRKKLN